MATEIKQPTAFKAVALETLRESVQASFREAGLVRRGADNKPYVLVAIEKTSPVDTSFAPLAHVESDSETEQVSHGDH